MIVFFLSTICFHICNVCDIVFPSLRSICLYLNWCTRPSDNFYSSKFFFFFVFFFIFLRLSSGSSFFPPKAQDISESGYHHNIFSPILEISNMQGGTTKLETFYPDHVLAISLCGFLGDVMEIFLLWWYFCIFCGISFAVVIFCNLAGWKYLEAIKVFHPNLPLLAGCHPNQTSQSSRTRCQFFYRNILFPNEN